MSSYGVSGSSASRPVDITKINLPCGRVTERLQLVEKARDLAFFNLAIDGKLCGCDLVSLRVLNVAQGNSVLPRATVMQRKTLRPVQFEITE